MYVLLTFTTIYSIIVSWNRIASDKEQKPIADSTKEELDEAYALNASHKPDDVEDYGYIEYNLIFRNAPKWSIFY